MNRVEKDFSSPLVGRVSFTEGNRLLPIRYLLGAGFQFLGSVVSGIGEAPEGIILFYVGCMVLDFFRRTSPSVNSRGMSMQPEIDPEFTSFCDYATDGTAGTGETFMAGCRNVNDSALLAINNNRVLFCEIVNSIHIGKHGGNIKDRVARNFKSLSTDLKRAMGRVQAENVDDD